VTAPADGELPELRLVWPIDGLDALAWSPRERTALVFVVENAEDFDERVLRSGLAARLVQGGVELFALVGKESEQAHDALDWVVEDAGAEDVITSWHDEDDPEDVASFVAASSHASGLARVVAVVDKATRSGMRLREHLAKAIRPSAKT